MSAEPDVSELVTVARAIEIIDDAAAALSPRVEEVALLDADGRLLAEDVRADRDYPPFDKSLMDGYAVRCADVARVPAELKVVGEIAAGVTGQRPLGAGEAIAIMTGAPMPGGADGVVPVEDVEGVGGLPPSPTYSGERAGKRGKVRGDADSRSIPSLAPIDESHAVPTPRAARPSPRSTGERELERIRVLRATTPGRFIARRGSDTSAGAVALTRGTRLGPAHLAVAATVGAARLKVFARPRVAVLSTGNELVPVDQAPAGAQIRNSNGLMLVSLLRRLGCDVTDLGVARDEPAAVRDAIEQGRGGVDALFVTGGMSMGAYDYVPRTLLELGYDLRITKLRIKPGKPFVFGVGSGFGVRVSGLGLKAAADVEEVASAACLAPHAEAAPLHPNPEPRNPNPDFVFGLPGNPVSAFVCTVRLASRLVARLAGETVTEKWTDATLAESLPANGPREFYQPVVLTAGPGRKVVPLKWKGSADLFTLARANALLARAENEPPLPAGAPVRVLEV